jgi:two-component system response regulator AgrA
MQQFIILDDDDTHNNNTKKRLELIFKRNNLQAQIALITTDPNEVVNYCIKNNAKNNVYLLDVNVQKGISGIDVAGMIRKQDAKAYIVFVSAYPEYVMSCLKTKIFDYLIKPVSLELLEACIKSIHTDTMKLNNQKGKVLSVKSGFEVYNLLPDEIIYFEKFGHLLILHTITGRIESSDSLDSIEQKFDKMKFFRCHKSFIVNVSYISRIDYPNSTIHLINGESCVVSKRCKKELKTICSNM